MGKRDMIIEIATDGSCYPNPGPGGWAAVFRMGECSKVLYGYDPDSTNNKMELTAAISALEHLKRPCELKLYCDSEYVVNGITKWIHRWKKNDFMVPAYTPFNSGPARLIANKELWLRLERATERHVIDWILVKGHGTHQMNIVCDKYAFEARRRRVEGIESIVIPNDAEISATATPIRSISLDES